MDEQMEHQPLFVIKDLETLKVITDPLRFQILEILGEEPQTVKSVADKLGMTSNRLYYHFNLLESAGLIQVVRTQTINNIIEKFYWTTAKEIMVDQDIVNANPEAVVEDINRVIIAALDTTKEDIIRSLHALDFTEKKDDGKKSNEISVFRVKKRLADKDYEYISKEFKQLLDKFQDLPEAESSNPESKMYSIAYFLYPTTSYENDDKDEKNKKEK
ncbi:MAG: helix-turn-helix transcriptional regulator [Anaerolineaceae bacterium]|nr:helix-turn-helix transcriptional regulator [Anaerolineaceae bacterium]